MTISAAKTPGSLESWMPRSHGMSPLGMNFSKWWAHKDSQIMSAEWLQVVHLWHMFNDNIVNEDIHRVDVSWSIEIV